jgi:hypothetical protein
VKTIAESWLEWCAYAMPDDVGEVQRREMRRAFFAGFIASMSEHVRAASAGHAEMLQAMVEWQREAEAFVLRVSAEVD